MISRAVETEGETAALKVLGIREYVQQGSMSADEGRGRIEAATDGLSPEVRAVADRIVGERGSR